MTNNDAYVQIFRTVNKICGIMFDNETERACKNLIKYELLLKEI